jgi:mannose-6-phosphate isomerase-like protein (cupin superfamily)
MKKMILSILLIPVLLFSFCAPGLLESNVFEWQNLTVKKIRPGSVRNILKSSTRSLEMFEIKAVTLPGGYGSTDYRIKKGVDELLIIKEGMAIISVNDISERLNEGSVVVASQGDMVKIQNGAKNDLTYYSFQFNPWKTEGMSQTIKKAESVIKEWRDIEFKTNASGGRRDIMRQPTSVLKELEMHTTQLKEGLPSHSSHTHADEEIILVRFGRVELSINGKSFQSGPGSVLFLTNDDDHGIRNVGSGPCEYYAIRWLTY